MAISDGLKENINELTKLEFKIYDLQDKVWEDYLKENGVSEDYLEEIESLDEIDMLLRLTEEFPKDISRRTNFWDIIQRKKREIESNSFSIKISLRGIGSDYVPCYMSDGAIDNKLRANISGFVNSKEDGQKIVNMFGGRAFLDYREREPNWIQVKFGVDEEFLPHLKYLEHLIKENGGYITRGLIEKSKSLLTKDVKKD
jgi:hypothetical protein